MIDLRQHAPDAVFPLRDGIRCPVEFEQADVGQFGIQQNIRRIARHPATGDPVLGDIDGAGDGLKQAGWIRLFLFRGKQRG